MQIQKPVLKIDIVFAPHFSDTVAVIFWCCIKWLTLQQWRPVKGKRGMTYL